jgi:hypothetical protein
LCAMNSSAAPRVATAQTGGLGLGRQSGREALDSRSARPVSLRGEVVGGARQTVEVAADFFHADPDRTTSHHARGLRLCLGNAPDLASAHPRTGRAGRGTRLWPHLLHRHSGLSKPMTEYAIDASTVDHQLDASLELAQVVRPGAVVHLDLKMAGHQQIRRVRSSAQTEPPRVWWRHPIPEGWSQAGITEVQR